MHPARDTYTYVPATERPPSATRAEASLCHAPPRRLGAATPRTLGIACGPRGFASDCVVAVRAMGNGAGESRSRKRLPFKAFWRTQFLGLRAQLWTCLRSKSCAHHIQKRVPSSPKRLPQLTFNEACFVPPRRYMVWKPAEVAAVEPGRNGRVKVHFTGWSAEKDQWIPTDDHRRIAPPDSHARDDPYG